MTEEVGKDPRASNLEVPEEVNSAIVAQGMVEENHVKGPPLGDEEREAIRFLADLGFEFISHDKAYLAFRQSRDSRCHLP